LSHGLGRFRPQGARNAQCNPGLDYLFEFGTWNKVAEIVRDMSLPSIICDSLTDCRSLIEQQAFQLVLCDDELPIAICELR